MQSYVSCRVPMFQGKEFVSSLVSSHSTLCTAGAWSEAHESAVRHEELQKVYAADL